MLFVNKHQFFTFVTTEKTEENSSSSMAQWCCSIFAMQFVSELDDLTLFTFLFAGDQGINYNVK